MAQKIQFKRNNNVDFDKTSTEVTLEEGEPFLLQRSNEYFLYIGTKSNKNLQQSTFKSVSVDNAKNADIANTLSTGSVSITTTGNHMDFKIGNYETTITFDVPSAMWYSDSTGPHSITGKTFWQGDQWLNTSNGKVSQYNGTNWTEVEGTLLGPTGPQGIQGIQGPTGVQGAKGDTGSTGVTGNGINNTTIDTNGHLIVAYTNGYSHDAGQVKGQKGDKGATGEQGEVGPTGATGKGIATAVVNSNGHLIVNYTDSTTVDAGSVVGPTGAKGDTGSQGPKGDTGAKGATGPKGDTGAPGVPHAIAYDSSLHSIKFTSTN